MQSAPSRSVLIELQACSKRLRERRSASARIILDTVDLDIFAQESLVVVGENGAGKTTLLKMLCGLAEPDSGRIERRVAMTYCGSGTRSLYPRLSVAENLRFFAGLHGLSGVARTRRIADVLATIDLEHARDRRIIDLSAGLRQRAAIARALIDDAPAIAFDEPTLALDPAHARDLRRFIRNVLVGERRMTVVTATNMPDEARALADRTLVVHAGRVAVEMPQSAHA